MNFSTNQVRQFYVLSTAPAKAEDVNGKIVITHLGTGLKQLVIDGTPTDLIDPAKITHIETTLASELAVYNKHITGVKVTDPKVGKSYTFKVLLYNLYGAGDETSIPIVASAEFKDKGTFYAALAKDLNRSVKNYKALNFIGEESGLTIETTVAEYNEGFDAATSPIQEIKADLLLDETVWTVDKWTKDTQAIASGAKLAELEWFCMGERADQYRMMGYPNIIRTKYKIDPTKEYDVVDICYFYSDNKEGVQRSEKVITIAVPKTDTAAGVGFIVQALNGTVEVDAEKTNTDKDFLDEE